MVQDYTCTDKIYFLIHVQKPIKTSLTFPLTKLAINIIET